MKDNRVKRFLNFIQEDYLKYFTFKELWKMASYTKENSLLRSVVVGLPYSDWNTVKTFVCYDEIVTLRRDLGNRFDKWAIAVFYNNKYKIGYIRAEDNEEVLPGRYLIKVIKSSSIIIERID